MHHMIRLAAHWVFSMSGCFVIGNLAIDEV